MRIWWHNGCKAFSPRSIEASERTPCIVYAAPGSVGVLRLRASCALRRSHCAQDDSTNLSPALDRLPRKRHGHRENALHHLTAQ